MTPKSKRKARGIVLWALGNQAGVGIYRRRRVAPSWWEGERIALLDMAQASNAGCPRLKPGESKKVRVVIEEVTPR